MRHKKYQTVNDIVRITRFRKYLIDLLYLRPDKDFVSSVLVLLLPCFILTQVHF